MKISEKLYNLRSYDFENSMKRKDLYHAVISIGDYRSLLREPESAINFVINDDGKRYADIKLYVSDDVKDGEIELW